MIQWAAFLYLGCIAFGSSFAWIKIALLEIGPLTLTAWRFAFGLATILVLLAFSKRKIFLRGVVFWLPLLIGVMSAAAPISLIGWAETRIDSGLAGVLNSTMPIWCMMIAHFALKDDRLTIARGLGLIIGFAGVFILMNPNTTALPDFWGQVAVIGAAILYATVLARKYLNGVHPLQTSVLSMSSACIASVVMAAVFEAPFAVPHEVMTWVSVSWMGIIGMGLAIQVWFYLINTWGATRTSMVAYVFPAAAVSIGVIFLNEPLTTELLIGGSLIIAGIALVNRQVKTTIPISHTALKSSEG